MARLIKNIALVYQYAMQLFLRHLLLFSVQTARILREDRLLLHKGRKAFVMKDTKTTILSNCIFNNDIMSLL